MPSELPEWRFRPTKRLGRLLTAEIQDLDFKKKSEVLMHIVRNYFNAKTHQQITKLESYKT